MMFIKYHADVLRKFASKDPFHDPRMLAIVKQDMLKTGDAGEQARERAAEIRSDIVKSESGDITIFAPFLDDFDNLATDMLADENTFHTWTDTYLTALAVYREAVVLMLKSRWLSNANKKVESEDKLQWLKSVILRVSVWLLPDYSTRHLPYPLLTASLLEVAWNSVNGVAAGVKEVSNALRGMHRGLTLMQ